MFECKVICDSISKPTGKRLTTICITYPRFIHSEILTHRDRARNSASSRAIPWPKMMAKIEQEPVIPIRWGSEQKGMQTGGEIERPDQATRIWLEARDSALTYAKRLADLGVHKSLVNRVTEPWMWITVVMTATEWKNFFRLRCHPDAEIHFQKIAGLIKHSLEVNVPQEKHVGEWHLPYIQQDEWGLDLEVLKKCSVARCARVSYLTHEGKRDVQKDLELFDRLMSGSGFGHMSPYEHCSQCAATPVRSGPFVGWHQYRKEFANENADEEITI